MSLIDCSSLSGANAQVCESVNAIKEAALVIANCNTAGNQFLNATGCFYYESPEAKMGALQGVSAAIDSGNTAWILASSALVMIMTPGLGFFYAGLAGEESASNTIMMSLASMAAITIQWFLFGYSFTFGPGSSSFGNFYWGALNNIGAAPSGVYGFGIPHWVFFAFQCMFAQITPALISGAVIGRMKFSSYIIFILMWTTFVYDAVGHWVWSWKIDPVTFAAVPNGFLNALGAIDFAGGTVIHITSGFAALAAAIVLGKRVDHQRKLKPHNVPMVIIGTTLLWFGWFGFNAGSAVAANAQASAAFVNTHLASCAAFLTWMIVEVLVEKTVSPVGAAAGAVAGLVCVTPGAGFVQPWAAVVMGIIVVPFCFGATKFKNYVGFDDTLDSWAIHGVGGVVGGFLTGLFADASVSGIATFNGAFYGNPMMLGYQVGAMVLAAVYSFIVTVLILLFLKYTIEIRVPEEVEKAGMDTSYHGGDAYNTKADEEAVIKS